MSRCSSSVVLMSFLAVLLFCISCSKESTPVQPVQEEDYFPFDRSRVWTYQTNVYADFGYTDTQVQMKIDTLSVRNGVFTWMWLRIPGEIEWAPLFALLDSANVIYSIGEDPPEQPFPLFKHRYAASEIVRETITVRGARYETVRYDLKQEGLGSVSWWFADGIGLVKEYSEDGITVFAADVISGVALTELVSHTK